MNELINKFLQENSTITEFCRKHRIKVSDFSKALRDNGCFVYRNATLNVIKFGRLAVDEYKNSITSLKKLSDKYGIAANTLSHLITINGGNVVNKQNIVRFDETVFDEIDTEEKAYWLGFIYADGYVESHTNKTRYGFELCLAAHDRDHLQKFNNFMCYNGNNVRYKKTGNAYRWNVRNKHLWNTLNNKGVIPRKSLILKFPDLTIFKTPDLVRHFIRGYFDGDGSISYNCNTKGFCSRRISVLGTKQFLEKLCEVSGYSGTMERKKGSTTFNLRFTKDTSINFSRYLYDDCTIYLDRKYKRFQKFELFNNAVPKSDLEEY